MFKQHFGFPMDIDFAPHLGKLFLYFLKSKCVQQLISEGSPCVYKFHGSSRFINEFCTINDDDELPSSYKNINPKQLELKIEHQGEYETFFYLQITIAYNIFAYKLFEKKGQFPVSLLCVGLIFRSIFHHHYPLLKYF